MSSALFISLQKDRGAFCLALFHKVAKRTDLAIPDQNWIPSWYSKFEKRTNIRCIESWYSLSPFLKIGVTLVVSQSSVREHEMNGERKIDIPSELGQNWHNLFKRSIRGQSISVRECTFAGRLQAGSRPVGSYKTTKKTSCSRPYS